MVWASPSPVLWCRGICYSVGRQTFSPFPCNNLMSTLYLVRHAQASFFAEDYDQLSDVVLEQAKRLGHYFAESGLVFDRLITGPAKRHRTTAALVCEAYHAIGLPVPEPVIVSQFDEHETHVMLGGALGDIVAEHAHLQPLVEGFQATADRAERLKSFRRLLAAIMKLWISDQIASSEFESYGDFRSRVTEGLRSVIENHVRGHRVLAVSSAGPISIILRQAMDSTVESSLELGWRLRNCSVNTFLFTKDRFTLDQFNSTAHLDDHLITHL